MTAQEVSNAVIVATSSSRYIALNYWQNQATGFTRSRCWCRRRDRAARVESLPIARQ